jgi:hypothetical protein
MSLREHEILARFLKSLQAVFEPTHIPHSFIVEMEMFHTKVGYIKYKTYAVSM